MNQKSVKLSIKTFFLFILLLSISMIAFFYLWLIEYFSLSLTPAATGYGLPTAIATFSIGLIAIYIQNETKEIARKKLILDSIMEYEKLHEEINNLIEKISLISQDFMHSQTIINKSYPHPLDNDIVSISGVKKIIYLHAIISNQKTDDTVLLAQIQRINELLNRINNKKNIKKYEGEIRVNIEKLTRQLIAFKAQIDSLYVEFFELIYK